MPSPYWVRPRSLAGCHGTGIAGPVKLSGDSEVGIKEVETVAVGGWGGGGGEEREGEGRRREEGTREREH